MKRGFLVALICCVPGVVSAQSTYGFGTHLGFTVSATYQDKQGATGYLFGPEVALDLPVSPRLAVRNLGSVQFLITGAVFSGYFSGNLSLDDNSTGINQFDYTADGSIYRLLIGPRIAAPNSGVYARIVAGVTYARSSNANFNSASAYEMQLAVGRDYRLSKDVAAGFELAYHQSNMAQVRGLTFGINARF